MTALAMASALENCPSGAEVFLGTNLSEQHRDRLRVLVSQFDGCTLHFHALSAADFGDTTPPDPKITLTALARLFLPTIAQGRLLYLDGDTLVRSSLTPLFTLDMQGCLLGVVRDQYVLRQAQRGKADLAYFQTVMGDRPATEYFNSGVLLMDLDAINADPNLVQKMRDFEVLEGYRYLDQDHLNALFAGRTLFLPHRWNSMWGRQRYQTALWRRLQLPPEETAGGPPAIIHFQGAKKPWKKLRLSILTQSLPAFIQYRLFQRRLKRQL